jgi:hypothetical protein
MRYIITILAAILTLNSTAQEYSSIIPDSVINNFINKTKLQNYFNEKEQDIRTICKTIGVWSDRDMEQIKLEDSIPWLENDSVFISRQIPCMNQLALWDFHLQKEMKFLEYNYQDKEWMWIYSVPIFSNDGKNCIVKVTKYWRYIFPDYKILAFSKQNEAWVLEKVLYNGIAEDNSLILPTRAINNYNDSITLAIFPRCDTLYGQTYNCYDLNGLKQGYWKRQVKKVLLNWSSYGTHGDNHGEEAIYLTINEGNYKDDKKIGDWIYYDLSNLGSNLNKEKDTVKIISYTNDGNIEERNFELNYHLKISADSSLISGQINYKLDIIKISCLNAKCVFRTSKEIELLRFDQSKLADEIFGLTIGLHDREIRIKNAH